MFDAHSHVGTWALFDTVPLAEQLAEMDRLGVGMAAVSALPALAGDIRGGNDLVAEVIRRHPARFIGYAHVSATYPESMGPELERCFALPGFRGIKIYQFGIPYDDARFEPAWAFASARRVPVLAHTWGGALTGLERAAARHPEVPVFAAHAGSDFAYQAYIDAARQAPNLYLDLTYSREHTNLIEHFVAELGAERVVWGADAPLFSMAHQAAKVLCARIPDAAKRLILGGTAARLFGLTLRDAAAGVTRGGRQRRNPGR
jgi:predicted TIM-barrel fold metal-dependent hydrolase